MRLGFVQFDPRFGDRQYNLRRIERLIRRVDADLLVLPELCTTGYTFLTKDEVRTHAEPATGPTYEFFYGLARERRCAIAYGFAECDYGECFNSMAVVSPEGFAGLYRKSHLFLEEKLFFTPGNTGFKVLTVAGARIGMLICFDWIFPEAARTLACRGVQIILHAANLVLPYAPDAMVTRAIENRVFTLTANRVGTERRGDNEYRFIGSSQIVSPRGEVLCRARTAETVRVVEIDPELALDKKITPLNDILSDRRPELYYKD